MQAPTASHDHEVTVAVAPGRVPVLGHLLALWRQPLPFLLSLRSAGPVVRVDLAGFPVHFLTTPELVHEVLITRASSFVRGRLFELLRPLYGLGLATTDGDLHRRSRRMLQPAFHPSRIAAYAPIVERRVRALRDSWRPGDVVVLDAVTKELALSVLAESLFSSRIGSEAIEEVVRLAPVLVEGALVRALVPRSFERLATPWNRRFNAAAAGMRRVVEDVIRRHQADDTERTDLVAMLLAARDPDTGKAMTVTEVRDEVIAILIGGAETTANTLCWTFYELARHPEAEARLHAEVDEAAGGGSIGWDDMARLDYTGRCIREALRLYPVTLIMRRCAAALEIGGARLPAGAEVAYSLYAMHRDPGLFANPDRFDPDRWLPDRAASLPHHAFEPFGNGAHRCIGESFGLAETVIALATIATRWRLRPRAGHTVREVVAAVPRPNAMPMVVVPRGG